MFFLGIETSCDETAVGIVDGTGRVLANVVATQVDVHARYGGIVPEVASRQHVLDIRPVCERAVVDAGLDWGDIDVVAPTHGPGLAGSLIVGLNFAKGLAASLNVPLVGVNHMDGHVYAAWAMTDDTAGLEPFQKKIGGRPIMCLVVSGGHTELVLLEGHGRFRLLGETRDDAAGEAFDKAARVLGLRYPGGPEIQRVAEGAPAAEPFPRAWMRGTDEFSFSGLKTAVINRARSLGIYPPPGEGMGGVPDPETVAGLARAFQESVVDVLVTKTIAAATRENCAGIVLAGGVAANRSLRETLVAESP
ncbi:MAG: tRNA (adenosine(37)-N6)-threonylcarbamoyltransferase complex transferase subunit TsaD, partial [Dehalococcoidia bacterium]|nr:tRNA (adenosine(37)-N6)-threonylcarbamoyltransferase complex transferase subunit TsaD [Dehalococcoidia bacterium]